MFIQGSSAYQNLIKIAIQPPLLPMLYAIYSPILSSDGRDFGMPFIGGGPSREWTFHIQILSWICVNSIWRNGIGVK